MEPKIIPVDDEPELLKQVRDYLHSEGFSVLTETNGIDGLKRIEMENPDLVLLDWMLPGLSGIEICKTLRLTSSIPIIMLTAKSEEVDRVLGLEFGADDYVAQQTLSLAQNDVDKIQQGEVSADILSAQTSVQQAQAQLETAQTNLGKATMVAPFDGVVTAVNGQVGQVMESTSNSSSKPGVTMAANPDVLQVEATIGQADINSVKLGQKAEITLDTESANVNIVWRK